eukprot:7492630-Lingulodinium_polyedra.AAC.1
MFGPPRVGPAFKGGAGPVCFVFGQLCAGFHFQARHGGFAGDGGRVDGVPVHNGRGGVQDEARVVEARAFVRSMVLQDEFIGQWPPVQLPLVCTAADEVDVRLDLRAYGVVRDPADVGQFPGSVVPPAGERAARAADAPRPVAWRAPEAVRVIAVQGCFRGEPPEVAGFEGRGRAMGTGVAGVDARYEFDDPVGGRCEE